jgi:EAL domain-containing protein (putative c-di-GMP-specific phosphodiesterase class I)
VLEVTESQVCNESAVSIAALAELRRQGVRVAIDDFGTGQSSLAHLSVLPVDTLKIDRSLIAGLGRQHRDLAIVSAIVGLGHALDLTVTAEGVEDELQLHTLRTLGCDLGQGFYFARPQPGQVVRALVHHRFRWSERISA